MQQIVTLKMRVECPEVNGVNKKIPEPWIFNTFSWYRDYYYRNDTVVRQSWIFEIMIFLSEKTVFVLRQTSDNIETMKRRDTSGKCLVILLFTNSPGIVCCPYFIDQMEMAIYLWLYWWRAQMETFSALLVFCQGSSPVTGEFPAQRPVTRSFDVFVDLRLNKRLIK